MVWHASPTPQHHPGNIIQSTLTPAATVPFAAVLAKALNEDFAAHHSLSAVTPTLPGEGCSGKGR